MSRAEDARAHGHAPGREKEIRRNEHFLQYFRRHSADGTVATAASCRFSSSGVVLLFPGLFSLLFMVSFLDEDDSAAGGWGLIWVITFLIAAGGIALIRYARAQSVRSGSAA